MFTSIFHNFLYYFPRLIFGKMTIEIYFHLNYIKPIVNLKESTCELSIEAHIINLVFIY